MRALLAACLLCTIASSACAPRRPLAPSSQPTPSPVAQSLTRATHRAPAARPTAQATPAAPLHEATSAPTAAVARVPLLDGLLDPVLGETDGAYSLVLEDLASGARTSINADQSFPSASLYKLGVAWATMRRVDAGDLSLDAPLEIQDEDCVEPEPDGGFAPGEAPSVREALTAMISVSSNAAAHALLRSIGRSAFTDEMDRIGLHQTRVPDDSLAVTSASDMARLLRLIATSPEVSQSSRSLVGEAMANVGPPDALRDTLPDSVAIFDKTGNLEDASNVGALLETPRATAILVVIDSGVDPGDARAIIAQVGQVAYHALLE